METLLPIMLAALVGMGHAFEADHLIAVSNIVSKRDSLLLAARDGVYWGLGHTTTIIIIGSFIILTKLSFSDTGFFEAFVGLMLVVMGISRLTNKNYLSETPVIQHQKRFAYGVGLVHGLAGSGILVGSVMSQISNPFLGISYLLIFGIGSIAGMLVAATLLGIPYTRRVKISHTLRTTVVVLSSVICIGYGCWMMYEHLLA